MREADNGIVLLDRLVELDPDLDEDTRSNFGQRLVSLKVANPKIKKYRVKGPPSVGKTSVIGDVEMSLSSVLGSIRFIHRNFEDAESKVIEEFKGRSIELWDEGEDSQQWQRVNEILLQWDNEELKEDELVLEENVGVGSKRYRNRGVSYFEESVKRSNERGDAIDIFLAPDLDCQRFGTKVRQTTLAQPEWNVVSFLYNEYNTIVRGVEGSQFENFPTSVKGRIIQDMYRTMAEPDHIERVMMELQSQADNFYYMASRNKPEVKRYVSSFPVPKSTTLPKTPKLDDLHIVFGAEDFQRVAFYLRSRLDELGVPRDQGFVALNEYDPNQVKYLYVDERNRIIRR